MKYVKLCLALGLCLIGATANAQTFNELGDATSFLLGQPVTNGITQIDGFLAAGDEDLYSFFWSGGSLEIDTFGTTGFDTQLHLFDGAGLGIGENDDAGGTLESEIALTLAAGNYFIGITAFNNDALDAAGNEIFSFTNSFFDNNGNTIQNVQVGGALAAWNGGGGAGGLYSINFSSAVGVPEPSSFAIACLCFGALAVGRRKR